MGHASSSGTCFAHPSQAGCGTFAPVSAPLEWGVSFVEALTEKYGTGTITQPSLSLVGAPPPPAVPDPSCVYVAYAWPGRAAEGTSCAPNLRDLDLTRSLLGTWDEVARIAGAHELRSLCLNHTRLAPCTTVASAFSHLVHLELGDTKMSWAQALCVGAAMPQLKSLHLNHNALHTLEGEGPAAAFPSLAVLNLEGNHLTSWAHVAGVLAQLPKLDRLVLTDNALATIVPATGAGFPSLTSIQLRGNPLRAEQELVALESWMPGPWSLVAPAHEPEDKRGTMAFSRLRTIAQAAGLVELDHTPISAAERTEAERYYLAHAAPGDARYAELCAKHGAPVAQAPAPQTLRTKMTTVRVVSSPTPPLAEDWERLQAHAHDVSVMATVPIRLLQRRLSQACQAPRTSTLWGVLAATPEPIVQELDDGQRDLAWYGVAEGDLVVLVPM